MFSEACIVGERALDGSIRAVNSILPITIEAHRRGKTTILVPEENAAEAALVHGITVYGVCNLRQTFEHLRGNEQIAPIPALDFEEDHLHYDADFADVKGQHAAKRDIEVAVARELNLLTLRPNSPATAALSKGEKAIVKNLTGGDLSTNAPGTRLGQSEALFTSGSDRT